MSLNVETLSIAFSTDVVSSSNVMLATDKYTLLAPKWQSRTDTATSSAGSAAEIGGINSMMVDGDLLICGSWGSGLMVYRIADNGTPTLIWQEVANITVLCGLAVDTANGIAYAGYWDDGIWAWDYSAFKAGGAGPGAYVTKYTVANSNLPHVGTGYPYFGGMYMCGDWLYFNRYNNAGAGSYVERWNPGTDTYETIAVTRAGGTTNYNGGFTYDPATDRLYQCSISGSGGLWVVLDPSSASPTAYAVYAGSYNFYPDVYTSGDDLVVWYHGYRILKINITDCITPGGTTTPTVVWTSPEVSTYANLFTGYHGIYRPEDVDIAIVRADRDSARTSGWVDLDNGILVSSPLLPDPLGTLLYSSYAYNFKKVTSAGASPTAYWVWDAYATPGLYTFAVTKGPRLETSWEIILGTFQLSDTANVKSAYVNMAALTVPSGCSVAVYASNNNGSDWQTITLSDFFDFETTGNQVQVKIIATGLENKGPYSKTIGSSAITLCNQPTTATISKVQQNRLAGVSHA